MKECGHILALLFLALAGGSALAEPPRACPALGLCLPIVIERVRDADTIEWRVPGSAFIWASRLIDVWAPETDSRDPELKAIALRGKAFAKEKCESATSLRVYIPLPISNQPLKSLTFDRIPSYIYLDDTTTLNEVVVKGGFASSKRKGKLGE